MSTLFRRFLRRFGNSSSMRKPMARRLNCVMFEDRLAPASTPVGFSLATPIDTVRPLSVLRNPADGKEVTYFKISNITNGTLFQDQALTKQINNGDFFSLSDGAGGVFSQALFYFQPTTGFVGSASIDVQAAEDAAGAGISTAFTSNIAVVSAATPYSPANSGLIPDVDELSTNKTSYDFVVEYKDAAGIDLTKLGDGDVVVKNRAGTFTQAAKFLGHNTGGANLFATYRITPPGGTWDATDQSNYIVSIAANEVFNTGGTAIPAQDISGFDADFTPPTAAQFRITGLNVFPVGDADAGKTSFTYTVEYVDGTGVDVATLNNSNFALIGPNGAFYGTSFQSVDVNTNGTPRNATYSASTPNAAGWSAADNGRYTIVSTGTAKNSNGDTIAAGIVGSFDVNIGGGGGGGALPVVNFTTTTLTQDEGNAADVVVTAQLDKPATQDLFIQVDFSGTATLNDPAGVPPLPPFDYTVKDFQLAPFTIQIPAGQTTGTLKINIFDDTLVEPTETAIVTIDPQSAGVTVGANNKFTLSITDNDTIGGAGNPIASIAPTPAIDDTFANTTKYSFEVTYEAKAPALIDATSISDKNVLVTGPGGFSENAVFVSSVPFPGNFGLITATYQFSAPGGKWDKTDNGDYIISVEANQVKDTTGAFVAATKLATVTASLTNTLNGGASGPVVLGYSGFGVGLDEGGGGKATLHSTSFGNQTDIYSVTPFANFTGGIRTAAADFNGDGFTDLIVATGPGTATQLKILDGQDSSKVLFQLAPFEASFTGGIFVAAGDINGDGTPDFVITPDTGGGPRCRVFNGKTFTQIADFYGIDDPNFRGGARAALSDISGDGRADLLVAAGFGGGPRLALYDGSKLTSTGGPKFLGDFFVFEQTLRNGVFLTAGDVNGDGFADVVVGGGPGGGPRVFGLSGKDLTTTGVQTQVANFFAGDPNSRGGVRVTMKDIDLDNKSDIITGMGTGAGSKVVAYAGKDVAANGTPNAAFSFDALANFTGGVFVG